MSYQSMGWAIEQPVSSPATRCVIMSIANHLGGDGHGWVYQDTIARESCMSVDTVQRRVPELIDAGILRRIKLKRFGRRTHDYYVLARSSLFGAPLDEIRPFLPASCDVIEEADHGSESESPTDTEAEMSTLPEADATASCGSVETPTLPHPAVDATALVRQQERILSQVSSNPKPLSKDERGFPSEIEDLEFEKDWEDFRTSGYPDGIVNIPAARAELKKRPHDQRRAAIVGVPAYADYCRKRGQKNPKPAHIYLRHGVWEGLSAIASVNGAPRVTSHSPQSEAGAALCVLAAIAGHSLFRLPNGNISYVQPVTAQLLALANTPPESDWIDCELGDQRFAAWRDLIYRIFAGRTLRASAKYRVPWAWPPTVDGKTYAGTDPPPGELSDADVEALTGT